MEEEEEINPQYVVPFSEKILRKILQKVAADTDLRSCLCVTKQFCNVSRQAHDIYRQRRNDFKDALGIGSIHTTDLGGTWKESPPMENVYPFAIAGDNLYCRQFKSPALCQINIANGEKKDIAVNDDVSKAVIQWWPTCMWTIYSRYLCIIEFQSGVDKPNDYHHQTTQPDSSTLLVIHRVDVQLGEQVDDVRLDIPDQRIVDDNFVVSSVRVGVQFIIVRFYNGNAADVWCFNLKRYTWQDYRTFGAVPPHATTLYPLNETTLFATMSPDHCWILKTHEREMTQLERNMNTGFNPWWLWVRVQVRDIDLSEPLFKELDLYMRSVKFQMFPDIGHLFLQTFQTSSDEQELKLRAEILRTGDVLDYKNVTWKRSYEIELPFEIRRVDIPRLSFVSLWRDCLVAFARIPDSENVIFMCFDRATDTHDPATCSASKPRFISSPSSSESDEED